MFSSEHLFLHQYVLRCNSDLVENLNSFLEIRLEIRKLIKKFNEEIINDEITNEKDECKKMTEKSLEFKIVENKNKKKGQLTLKRSATACEMARARCHQSSCADDV